MNNHDLRSAMADDLADIIGELSVSVTFGTATVNGSLVRDTAGRTDQPYGMLTDGEVGVIFPRSAFTALPSVQDLMTVDGVKYRVTGIQRVDTVSVIVTLREAKQ